MIVTTLMLKQKYKDYSNPLDKIRRDADRGILFRLNRFLMKCAGGGYIF